MVDVSRCCITQALSFLSVIMIALTWHTLQVSHPYQPRLFLPALGILSTSIRPLSLTSRCYARERASPSPTDGHSPTIQPPPLSSSCHHHHWLSSWPCGLARMQGTHCPVSWTCMVSRDTIPQWWTSVDAAYYAHCCSQVVQQDHLSFTCSKRAFMDVKAALISLGSPSHSHCPLLVNVECRFGV
jgi:hypothetical protein